MASIFEFEQVTYRYGQDSTAALDSCSVQLPAGQKIAIIGPNGSGKSTFFLHCNGVYQPDRGRVLFKGQPLQYGRRPLNQLRQQVGIVFQNPDDQLFSASVAQDISFGPLNLGLSEPETGERVREAAELCAIGDLLDRPTHALSGGQKARVALAGVLALQPEILLIDEPTASLDPTMRRQIFSIFDDLMAQQKTLVLATHEYEIARYWADFVVVLHHGRVLLADTPEEIFARDDILGPLGLDRPWYDQLMQKSD